jgi:hypothetical protein
VCVQSDMCIDTDLAKRLSIPTGPTRGDDEYIDESSIYTGRDKRTVADVLKQMTANDMLFYDGLLEETSLCAWMSVKQ